MDREALRELGRQLRVDAVRAADAAGSGHPTSSMSAADLMAVLLAEHLRYDWADPSHPGNDHLIFSKGHASPLLYAMFKAVGAVSDEELLSFRELGSRLEGHPTPRLPWVEVATGSLGQGLPIGAGIALAGRRLDDVPYRVWVLCGDSELAEGSMWEAFEHAGYEHLENLVAVVDVNRLGQRGPTRHGWDTGAYRRRIEAFDWRVVEVDGHDVAAIDEAYRTALTPSGGRPTAVLARTLKGSGVPAYEDREGLHGKPLPDARQAIAALGGPRTVRVAPHGPHRRRDEGPARQPGGNGSSGSSGNGGNVGNVGIGRIGGRGAAPNLPRYERGEEVATRDAFGTALAALGAVRPDVVAVDGEVADSTRTEAFGKEHPERFFECYIAEQQMLAVATGLQVRGRRPYAATFAAFLSRAHDFLRMAAVSRADLAVVGSHAGVAIGEDGPSQMGLEDLALFRALHGSTVLYPCDAHQTARLVVAMADLRGIAYLRTTRGKTPVLYPPDEEFPVGGSKPLRASDEDRVTLVAAGTTVHEALRAADRLAEEGVRARVLDLYSVKPVDTDALRAAAALTGRFVTVEDHWPEGGLADAVLGAFADGTPPPRLVRLAVRGLPASAEPAEQLRAAGIDADAIAAAARRLTEDRPDAA